MEGRAPVLGAADADDAARLEREPDASDIDDVRVRMMELRGLCSRMS